METLGWLGAMLLGLCGLPAAHKVVVDGHAHGLSGLSVLMWWLGEVFTIVYVLNMKQVSMPLLANYIANLGLVSILIYYKVKPRIT